MTAPVVPILTPAVPLLFVHAPRRAEITPPWRQQGRCPYCVRMHAQPPDLQLLVVRTTAVAAEAIASQLDEAGALGSAIERKRGARLVHLQAYFAPETHVPVDEVHEMIARLHEHGVPVGPGELRLQSLAQEEWSESWKRHFHAFRVTDRLVVAPTWEKVEGEMRSGDLIRLDPGMAFGLGDHPTTRGCLTLMERMRPTREGSSLNFRTADVGTGTGILAIRAAQLGMGPVEAFDTDPEAVRSARESADQNGVLDGIVVREGTLPARGVGPYERVLANILLGPLLNLLPRMAAATIPGGEILVAGILIEQEDRMRAAAETLRLSIRDRICEPAQRGARRWPVLLMRKEDTAGS